VQRVNLNGYYFDEKCNRCTKRVFELPPMKQMKTHVLNLKKSKT